ncbi:tRNA pseudouridine(54/55) synthase Pus10 [Thermoplasma sp.]|uniref:tRNA pseudouridine(54/55) synthase Pus10 n=1 Tax=Thermoplasma sp. TaxID=1973142 RepID=UPI001273C23D|nr:tRNA pseudouridine(54/55) synthase Pus10 [Thermoplasma sp.]KAA8922061.1 MAG: tRNA pseudouridine(54/55) synthase Pus10 [Thermoplasma sp.]
MFQLSELANYHLCKRCSGRVFAYHGHGISNLDRGEYLRFAIGCEIGDPDFSFSDPENCQVCHGIFDRFEDLYDLVMKKIDGAQYKTFLVGSVFSEDTIRTEEEIQKRFGSTGESIKKEFNREFGKYFSARTGKEYSQDNPDLTIMVNAEYLFAEVKIRSVYIYGKYRKFRRDMPQTRWIHRPDGDTVESVIGSVLVRYAEGTNYYLHGSGREDVDVRMLGNGREFVLEIENPKYREFDLRAATLEINASGNGVEVLDLRFAERNEVSEVKLEKHNKVYDALIVSDSPVDEKRLSDACLNLAGKNIYQRTPLRVAQRRSDLVRTRHIDQVDLVGVSGNEAEIVISAEAGTYIKELVNGDGGRTKPSLSELYGSPLNIKELDVIKICRGED